MQKRLGHADARATLEVYTHVQHESERKAAELMDSVLRAEADFFHVPEPSRPGRVVCAEGAASPYRVCRRQTAGTVPGQAQTTTTARSHVMLL